VAIAAGDLTPRGRPLSRKQLANDSEHPGNTEPGLVNSRKSLNLTVFVHALTILAQRKILVGAKQPLKLRQKIDFALYINGSAR
jgi:hypothetical protein